MKKRPDPKAKRRKRFNSTLIGQAKKLRGFHAKQERLHRS